MSQHKPGLLLWALAVCLPAGAATRIQRQIAPGVQLTQIIIPANEAGGPELIHALSIDTTRKGLRLEAGLGGGTVEEPGGGMEAVARQVIRTGALAGINADFFPYTGDPLGLTIHDGEIVSEPFGGRGAVGLTWRGQVVIGRPEFRGSVSDSDGAALALNGVNRKPADGELVLFSPLYGAKTPAKAATIVTLDVPNPALKPGITLKTRVLRRSEEAGAVPMPPRGLVLSATGAAAQWLRDHAEPGMTLYLRGDIVEEGQDWSIVREAVGGGPVILRDGREDIQLAGEKMARDFSTSRHPRSVLGVTREGRVLLVAVDGRQALSRGMSLPELAATMKDLGAVDAVNLDGGGSTCLSVRGLVVNCPSDGQVRRVADSLLLFDDTLKPVPAAAFPRDAADAVDLPSDGRRLALSVPSATGEPLWGTVNGGAFVAQDGAVYGYKPGTSTVVAMAPDGAVVLARAFKVLPGPAGKMLTAWTEGTLRITMRDVNNNPVQGQEISLTKSDGTQTEVTTGPDGRADVPKGWLKDDKERVSLLSGVLTRTWPEAAP